MTAGQMRAIRAYLAVSQQVMANALEVHRVTVARWESEPREGDEAAYLPQRHRRIDRAWAEEIKRASERMAREKGLPLAPLKKLFTLKNQ